MSKDSGPWDDARRAWARLAAWRRGRSDAASAEADLDALSDIGLLRRLLDQAELAAVRAARGRKKSWAEIATRLGVSRQSAWERWRDLDDEVASLESRARASISEPAELSLAPDLASYIDEEVANERRKRSKVIVPNVVGRRWDDARATLLEKGLVAVGDPDALPLEVSAWHDSVVTDQSPESGARVPAGSTVRLWIGRSGGGSAGVREPRRPSPSPLSARELRPEPSDEAVG